MVPYALNLRHLFMVSAINRAGSITAACDLVHLSQPAITQGLAGLERQLGCMLFLRQPGGTSLTQAGQILLTRVDRTSKFLAEGMRSFRGTTDKILETHVTMAHLRALIAVSAHGSFSLAAQALELSQPSVHRAARELEQIIGQALFTRTGRTTKLTAPAARFTNFSRLALAELRAGLDEISALTGGDHGRVVIGSMPLARASIIPHAIAKFCKAYPAASVSIIEGPYDELLSGLRTGEIDMLLGALRQTSPSSDVIQQPLSEDKLSIIGRHGHPLASVASPSIRELSQYPWVISRQGTPLRAGWEAMFTSGNRKPPPARVECSSVMAIRGLLLEGDWLTLLSPGQIQLEKAAGLLIEIGQELAHPARRIGMTTRKDWLPTLTQRAMAGYLKDATLKHLS